MTAEAGRGAGPVDRYLDEMFDLLAGAGAAGRRMLIEAEEHLIEATAEGRARGLDAETAEREAVGRFGAAAAVARGVPAGAGTARTSLRRLATAAWALTGAALAWYGLSGALTWLLSWPWTRLLIATDWFGVHPMCEPPWLPVPLDCVRAYQPEISVLPGADNDFPYLFTAGVGAMLVVGLLILRRTTAIGAPSWTPSRRAVGWLFAAPFGLTGADLLVEAIDGMTKDVQYYVLACMVAGLLAVVIGAVASWRALSSGGVKRPDRLLRRGGRVRPRTP
jgi:hypothetical protein